MRVKFRKFVGSKAHGAKRKAYKKFFENMPIGKVVGDNGNDGGRLGVTL